MVCRVPGAGRLQGDGERYVAKVRADGGRGCARTRAPVQGQRLATPGCAEFRQVCKAVGCRQCTCNRQVVRYVLQGGTANGGFPLKIFHEIFSKLSLFWRKSFTGEVENGSSLHKSFNIFTPMENHSSIGFFLLNFAMQEGNKTHPQVIFDLLIQTHSP